MTLFFICLALAPVCSNRQARCRATGCNLLAHGMSRVTCERIRGCRHWLYATATPIKRIYPSGICQQRCWQRAAKAGSGCQPVILKNNSYPCLLFVSGKQKILLLLLILRKTAEPDQYSPPVSDDASGPCLTITYNPMVMPKGVEPSADPMLAARAAPYAISLGRRLTEGAKQQ